MQRHLLLTSSPTISIIIPCYNREDFIAKTIQSVLDQSFSSIEILVIDDGSTDNTQAVLEPFRDAIRYFRIPHSGGPSRPRNIGLQNAVGDLISFFDSDDLMLPGKLAAAAQVFQSHSDIDFLFTNFQSCDKNGTLVDPDYLSRYEEFRKILHPTGEANLSLLNGTEVYPNLLHSNFIGTSSVVARSHVFTEVGNFKESMPNAEDFNLWCRIARHGSAFAFLNAPYHSYRIHPNSITQKSRMLHANIIKEYELNLLTCDQPEIQEILNSGLRKLWFSYGYALRNEGKWREARLANQKALEFKITWPGVKGLILSLLHLRRSPKEKK